MMVKRWTNILGALVIMFSLGFLSGALTEWNGQRSELEYPAQEFGRSVSFPQGFWLYGTGLFFIVTIAGGLLALVVRNAVLTFEGFDNPRGSIRLQTSGFTITGLGVSFSSLNPVLGPLVFMVGLACLVVSFQQKSV